MKHTFWLGWAIWLLLPTPGALAQGSAAVDAIAGEPLGVGRVTLDLPPQELPAPLGADGLGLTEKDGRVLYPAMRSPMLGGLLREMLGARSPLTTGGPVREQAGGLIRGFMAAQSPRLTIYFLFRGDEPLSMTLEARKSFALQAVPRRDPALHRLLLAAWWRDYSLRRQFQGKPDYPPMVENYLASTLARRLNLRLPGQRQIESGYAQLERELGVSLATESILVAFEQDRILGLTNFSLAADQPLPAPVAPPPLDVPEPEAKVAVEPIAMHVPAEWFYVRFGSFSNFLWLQDTLETWGGDMQNLVAQRGLDYGRSERMQRQLILRMTQVSRLLGETVISDVAIVGSDMFFHEGAAVGFLFEARNNFLLGSNLAAERAARLARGGVAEQKLKIAGQSVSFISSPDGGVRSYYVQSGDYHLITSSRTMVEQFLAVAKGAGSLGATKEFRYARTIMPLGRNDTVFVYFSDAFFRAFTSPRYRVEMTRRLEADADIELVQLAILAAAAEGRPGGTIEQLIGGGMLPADFGPRPDGSRAVMKNGAVYDQLRGRRGAMLPIPDVAVGGVTAAEAASYGKFADFYAAKWGRADPMMIGLKRQALPQRRERVAIDLRMMPLDRRHYECLSQWVGPPEKTRLAAVPGDVAAGEVMLRNFRLFGGLRDVAAPTDFLGGNGSLADRLRGALVGYFGTYGRPGFLLNLLDLTFLRAPDAAGFSANPLGLWRQKFDQFTVYSFQPDLLAAVAPQLRFEESPHDGQVWARIGDVLQARVAPTLNNWGYSRTRETALGDLRLLHALNQQLHVPPERCKETAESLLAATLICPLGGKLVLRPSADGESRWTSTALEGAADRAGLFAAAPPGFLAPPLNWFRGLNLEAKMGEDALTAHAEVVMQLPEAGPRPELVPLPEPVPAPKTVPPPPPPKP